MVTQTGRVHPQAVGGCRRCGGGTSQSQSGKTRVLPLWLCDVCNGMTLMSFSRHKGT